MDVRSFFGGRRPQRVVVIRRKRPAVRRARTAPLRSVPKRAKKAITAIANRVFSARTETNYCAELYNEGTPTDIYGHTYPGGVNPQLYDCLPGVSVGEEEFQRNGVKIQPTRHSVDLDIRFNERKLSALPATKMAACAWDITCHVWYGYARRFKNNSEVAANAGFLLQQLLEDGQGNNALWDGTSIADFNKLNKEVMVLKHKSFRMFRSLGSQNTADSTQSTYFPQTIRKRLTLSFKPPKTLLYNDGVDLPDNYAPFVIIGYQHNDGTNASSQQYVPQTPTVTNTPALEMCMKSHLWYKDA